MTRTTILPPGSWYGIDIRDGGSADLHQVRIRYAAPSSLFPQAVVKAGSVSSSLTESVIELGNREGTVVQNTDAYHVVWWGHPSGPSQESENPEGQGDLFLGPGSVDASPYLLESAIDGVFRDRFEAVAAGREDEC